jgi:flagellar protein FlgJ
MDINGLGSTYLDNYRLSAASSVHNPNDFSKLLEKVKSTKENAAEGSISDGRRVTGSEIDKNDKLYQLCLELETFLVKNLLTGMRNTVQKSGLIDEGFAGKMYEDMLYDEYAKDFTKNAGFGLAESAYLQLKQYNDLSGKIY